MISSGWWRCSRPLVHYSRNDQTARDVLAKAGFSVRLVMNPTHPRAEVHFRSVELPDLSGQVFAAALWVRVLRPADPP